MKILHINSYFNGSSFYKNLYKEQQKKGTEIDVFVPVPLSYKDTGIDYGNYTKISKNHKSIDRFFFHIKHIKIFRDILTQYSLKEYSIAHAHSLFSNGFIAWKLKKKLKLPYIVAVRNTDLNVFFEKMPHLRNLGVQIIKDAEVVVFLSSSYLETTIQKYIPKHLREEVYNKSVVIPNGVDEYWINNIGESKKIDKLKCIKILYVGIIDENKNLLKSIEAIELLRQKNYKVEFTVVGKIKNKKIYNQIKSFSFVNYIPPQKKEELREIYLKNDIFLMPSLKETFGLVYVEAMTQGLPVIYTKKQGFDKQFEEGEIGFRVDSYDAKDISEKIIKIINNYSMLSDTCIKKCDKFQWEFIAATYLKIYLDIYKDF